MFDNILVPTDGSECAEAAVGYAEDLATRTDASIHVLCVADSRTLENAPEHDLFKKERTEIAERTANELSESGVSTEQAVRTDIPHRAIREYATEADIDLIVMGTHGRTGVERFLLGSVTEKVVRLSDVPVLTVPAQEDGDVTYPYSDILVPTDGSQGAEVAISPAIEVATTYDARIHALSVVDTMGLGVERSSGEILNALEDSAQSAVDTVAEQATEASVSVAETTTEHGTPSRRIRSYIEDHDIGLVVMGTHGRSGIERYLLGSVAEKTVRTSPAPVMTIRQPE